MTNDETVNRALRLYASGKSYREVGADLGVSRQRVHQLIGHLIVGAARLRQCARCETRFEIKGGKIYCASCAARRKRERKTASQYNRCSCGRKKNKKSRRCRVCYRGAAWDVPLAIALYQFGYPAQQVAGYLEVTQVALYLALSRRGVYAHPNDRLTRRRLERQPRGPIGEAAALIHRKRKATHGKSRLQNRSR